MLPDAPQGLGTTGPVSGNAGKASRRRSTSRRTAAGSGLGSIFLRQALADSENACAGNAALPAPPTRRSTSLALSRFTGSLQSKE